MTTDTHSTQVYQVFVKATPGHVIHSSEGRLYGDEAVLEWDPPR